MNVPSMPAVEVSLDVWEMNAKAYARDCIVALSIKYHFNAEEECVSLGLDTQSLKIKPKEKKGEKKASETKVRVEKVREEKVRVPMPFIRETVVADGCCGLSWNRSLLTQCPKKRSTVSEQYCDKCLAEANKNASGIPDCGTVAQRLAVDLYKFKDPKDRSPGSYITVLEKLKIDKDIALAAAGKLGVVIPEEHFRAVEVEKKAGGRGRPKKPVAMAVQSDNQDLFASIAPDTEVDFVDELAASEVVDVPSIPKSASEAEKEAKKDAIIEERAEKKAALDAEKAAKKAVKEAEKAAEKAAKEAAKADEKAAKEAEKAATKAAEKAAKEAEKAATKAAEKAAKEAEKATKKAEKKVVVAVAEPEPEPEPVKAVDEAKLRVVRTQIQGKQYLKSQNNTLYDIATQEPIGIWDETSSTILPLPDDDDDEEEVEGDEEVDEEEVDEEYV